MLFDLSRVNQGAFRNVEIAKVERDVSGFRNRAPDQRDFSLVLPGGVDCELDAMNRRREARNKKFALGPREDLIEFAPNGALAGRISAAVGIRGVLQQRQNAAVFAIFGESVEIKQPVISGRGINLEVAGMDHDSQRCVDGQGDAIHQAVRNLNGIDGERTQDKARSRADFAKIGVVE